jgi:hypothetical protein
MKQRTWMQFMRFVQTLRLKGLRKDGVRIRKGAGRVRLEVPIKIW